MSPEQSNDQPQFIPDDEFEKAYQDPEQASDEIIDSGIAPRVIELLRQKLATLRADWRSAFRDSDAAALQRVRAEMKHAELLAFGWRARLGTRVLMGDASHLVNETLSAAALEEAFRNAADDILRGAPPKE